MERFEAYYHIWTSVYALAANLEAAILTRNEEPFEHLPWYPNSAEPYDPESQADRRRHRATGRRRGLRDGWHNPLNEDEDSLLRPLLADSRHEEPQHFAQLLIATSLGSETLGEWQTFVASCRFTAEGLDERCQGHATVQTCREYCDLIDMDWMRIADWYRPASRP